VILYRQADPRFPFLQETANQPAARWHAAGEGPVQYLADTPDGAWAEFIRHEEITREEELENVRRALWVIHVPDSIRPAELQIKPKIATGGLETYQACQAEARRLRAEGAEELRAPSAALLQGQAGGWMVKEGLKPGPSQNGFVFALFGPRPDLVGWAATVAGRPSRDLLKWVRYFGG
jgi:RES domain